MYSSTIGRRFTSFSFTSSQLSRLTHRHGSRMNSPASRHSIETFIRTYGVNTQECERDPQQYQTFNEFFARRLKRDARPIDSPSDPSVLVSPADARILVFEHLEKANQIWLKGAPLNIETILTEQFKQYFLDPKENPSGQVAVAICRLSPAEYHRWHSPLSGLAGPRKLVEGTFYSVSPWAVRSLDVLGKNQRVVCMLESEEFGPVAFIPIGAAMVASMKFESHTEQGCTITKGQPHGWFENGGSTIVMLFRSDRVQFDADLVRNSLNETETLVKMGERIGIATNFQRSETEENEQPEPQRKRAKKETRETEIDGYAAPRLDRSQRSKRPSGTSKTRSKSSMRSKSMSNSRSRSRSRK